MKAAVDCREIDQGNVRQKIVLGNTYGGKPPGNHGRKVILLSHA